MEFMYFVLKRMPGEIYRRRLRSLFDVFREAKITPLFVDLTFCVFGYYYHRIASERETERRVGGGGTEQKAGREE